MRREKIYPIFLPISEAPIQKPVRSRHYAVGSITAEQMVRSHREEEATRDDSERLRNAEFRGQRPVPPAPWYRALNWLIIIDLVCIAALIGCLSYLGVVVFVPFALKLINCE